MNVVFKIDIGANAKWLFCHIHKVAKEELCIQNFHFKATTTAHMEKMLSRIEEGKNTETMKALVYNDIRSSPYVIGDETLGKVSEIVEVTLSSKDKGDTQISKHASFL